MLPILRCNLISGVAGKMPTPDLKIAATYAYAAANVESATDDENAAATAAVTDAYTAAGAGAAATYDAAAATCAAAYAADASAAAAYDFWVSLKSDCEKISKGEEPLEMPVWLNGENPFEDVWRDVVSKVNGPEWAFWIKWYEDALAGTPPNWKMLEKIALIDPEIWDAGAVAVSERIAEIELEYAVLATPNAEEIRISAAGKYEAVARSTLPAQTLQDANDRIGDVIRQIRAAQEASNQYAALNPEADLLEDVQERYGDNALRLHEVCFKVIRHVGGYISDGVLPENDNLIGDVTVICKTLPKIFIILTVR